MKGTESMVARANADVDARETERDQRASTRTDVDTREVARDGGPVDESPVDRLARAIDRASAAGEWSIVELLGRQLEALTRASAGNVVDLAEARRGRR